MEEKNQVSREQPSLLILNDDCLHEIVKFLQIDDFVNLAETCSRLFFVAQNCKKYKNIEVRICKDDSTGTVEEFSNNLSVIGAHVASVHVYNGYVDILKTIADSCTNLRSVQLEEYSTGALPFRNLKELKLWCGVFLSTDEWKHFFENNPGIVCLEYWDYGRNKCLPLLEMLPELKSLEINYLQLKPEEFHHLSCLTSVTKFSFTNRDTCYNQLLIELAVKLNLVELKVRMPCDADTFAALKSFRHLEVLLIGTTVGAFARIPETAIFPSTLKKIQIDCFGITYSVFQSILKQLKLLEQLDIGLGRIFWNNDETEYFPSVKPKSEDIQGSRIISGIANGLRAEKRKLKMTFIEILNFEGHKVWMFSDNLEIIGRPFHDKRVYDHTFKMKSRTLYQWMAGLLGIGIRTMLSEVHRIL